MKGMEIIKSPSRAVSDKMYTILVKKPEKLTYYDLAFMIEYSSNTDIKNMIIDEMLERLSEKEKDIANRQFKNQISCLDSNYDDTYK